MKELKHSHLKTGERESERKQCLRVMQQSLQWINAGRNDTACVFFLLLLLLFPSLSAGIVFRLSSKSFHVSVQRLHKRMRTFSVSDERKRQDNLKF